MAVVFDPSAFLASGDLTAWTSSGGVITAVQDSTAPDPSGWTVELTPGGVSAEPQAITPTFPVTAGDPYLVAGWLNTPAAFNATIGINWYGTSGKISSDSLSPDLALQAATWTQAQVTLTAPGGATYAQAWAAVDGGSSFVPQSQTLEIQSLQVTDGTPPASIPAGSITGSQIASNANIAGSQLSPSAGIMGSQLAANAGITAGQVSFTASSIGGIQVTISSTAPASPHTGDLWYDAANGYVLEQWNGTAWTAYQWGSGALGSGSVGTPQIASGAVGAAQIASGSITSAQISSTAAITAGQVSFNARDIGGITTTVASTAPASPQPGDLWYDTSNGYRLNQYQSGGWTSYLYGTGALAAGSVTASLIAAGTITATQIASGTITGANIASATITASNIAAGTITASQIASGTITATQIAAGTITGNLIAAGTITGSLIAAGTVTASNIASGTVVAGIVNGTTVEGATIIAYGTSGEYFAYSGTPAAGNLVSSVAAANGTDPYGNPYIAGVASYWSGAQGVQDVLTVDSGKVTPYEWDSTTSQWLPTGTQIDLTGGTAAFYDDSGHERFAAGGVNPATVGAFLPGGQVIAASDPNNTSNVETWHDVTSWGTYFANYSASRPLAYKLMPDGTVRLSGPVKCTGTGSINGLELCAIPTQYAPVRPEQFQFGVYHPSTSPTEVGNFAEIDSNGTITIYSLLSGSNFTYLVFQASWALDGPTS